MSEELSSGNFKGEYGQSTHGNYKVVDTIGVPHPYCIGPRHIAVAAKLGRILGPDAIEEAERQGVRCDICRHHKLNLSYAEHQRALLVECLANPAANEDNAEELNAYMKSIVDECERNGYAGVALLRKF